MKIQAKDTGFYYYILTYMLLRSTLTTNGSGNGFGSLLRTILVLDLPLGSQWMEKKKRKKRYKYSPRSAVSCLWLLEGRSYPHNSSQGTGVYSSHCRYKYSLGKEELPSHTWGWLNTIVNLALYTTFILKYFCQFEFVFITCSLLLFVNFLTIFLPFLHT